MPDRRFDLYKDEKARLFYLLLGSADRSWMRRAGCQDSGLGPFFDKSRRSEGLSLCRRCDVKRECADYGYSFGGGVRNGGIWGGLLPSDLALQFKGKRKK